MSNLSFERQKEILIVDDTPANLRLLTQILAEYGYKVRAVTNGMRALASAEMHTPDLILLDIMMPEMDGYEVCQRLKADSRTRDVPVIFISALGDTGDKVRAFAVGGVDYITKPFQTQEVLARVETHLTLRNLQQSLQQQIAELDAFAHTVAHDLKHPLGLLVAYSSTLAEILANMPDEVVQEGLQTVIKVGLKMGVIIDELLLLASVRKLEAVTLEPLDMTALVSGAQERLAAMIAEYQAEIILPAVWPLALGRPMWVEEIWANYISNAIKYGGKPPWLKLGATLQQDARSERSMVRCWVVDNGPGLAPEDQARLFVEFTQLRQVRIEGQGLGLSIVRRIVEKLGGQVGVESKPGQGSMFFFTLPAAESQVLGPD